MKKSIYYIIIATAWILVILNAKTHLTEASICAIVHLLSMIGEELNKMSEIKKEHNEDLIKTIHSVALDLRMGIVKREAVQRNENADKKH